MQYLKDIGFIVRRVNVGDADRFITLFTRNNGKVEIMAKGVRKITSKRASSVELLNKISFQAVRSSKNYILTEVELISPCSHMKKDLVAMQGLFLISELIHVLCPHNQKQTSIFNLLEDTLHVDKFKTDYDLFDFQVKLLAYLGYWDPARTFSGQEDLTEFIEQITERKLRTPAFL